MMSVAPGRFVVLYHECPADDERPSHYDLMLEHEGVLLTWALAEPPRLGAEQIAERLPDHRLRYLDYEGPVSGDRGHVVRWDRGECRIERASEDELLAILSGERISGRLVGRREPDGWRLSVSDR